MAGIKLFKFNQKYCRAVGIRVPQENQSRHRFSSLNWIYMICMIQFEITLVAYLWNEANSMGEYGAAFFPFICAGDSIFAYPITTWEYANILQFIKNCEEFIDKRTGNTNEYEKVNARIDQLIKWFFIACVATIISFVAFSILYTGVSYFILDLGVDSFYLYPPTEWPFDSNTPIGYLVAWFGGSIGTASYILAFLPFFINMVGSCFLFISIGADITKDLNEFNINVANKASSATERSNAENRIEVTKQFCALVQVYEDAKRCVSEFNRICEFLLFIFFVWTILFSSSALVTMQILLREDEWNMIVMVPTGISVFWSFALNFAVCELGQGATSQFEMFEEELSRCNWYLLPSKLQRAYLMFMLNTQQPVHIRCYGGIECSRDRYKKISHKGFSYFMALRQMR